MLESPVGIQTQFLPPRWRSSRIGSVLATELTKILHRRPRCRRRICCHLAVKQISGKRRWPEWIYFKEVWGGVITALVDEIVFALAEFTDCAMLGFTTLRTQAPTESAVRDVKIRFVYRTYTNLYHPPKTRACRWWTCWSLQISDFEKKKKDYCFPASNLCLGGRTRLWPSIYIFTEVGVACQFTNRDIFHRVHSKGRQDPQFSELTVYIRRAKKLLTLITRSLGDSNPSSHAPTFRSTEDWPRWACKYFPVY